MKTIAAVIACLVLPLSVMASESYQAFRSNECAWCGSKASMLNRLEWCHLVNQSVCKTNGHPEWINAHWNGITMDRRDHLAIQHHSRGTSYVNTNIVEILLAAGIKLDPGVTNALKYWGKMK